MSAKHTISPNYSKDNKKSPEKNRTPLLGRRQMLPLVLQTGIFGGFKYKIKKAELKRDQRFNLNFWCQ